MTDKDPSITISSNDSVMKRSDLFNKPSTSSNMLDTDSSVAIRYAIWTYEKTLRFENIEWLPSQDKCSKSMKENEELFASTRAESCWA